MKEIRILNLIFITSSEPINGIGDLYVLPLSLLHFSLFPSGFAVRM